MILSEEGSLFFKRYEPQGDGNMDENMINRAFPASTHEDDQHQICLLSDPDRGYQLHLLEGAVNTIVVKKDSQALLINCCDTITGKRLAGIQVSSVTVIALTQHTRLHQAGRAAFPDARLIMPEASFQLLDQHRDYWQDEKWRYHLYYFTPGRNMPVIEDFEQFRQKTETVISGQTFGFHDLIVKPLATPGPADDSMSYVFEWPAGAGKTMKIACCGDLMVAGSRLRELVSLQKGFGNWTDYHGFLGRCGALMKSLRQLQSMNLDMILPAHGPPIRQVNIEIELLIERLINLFNHYAAISSLHYYCPDWLGQITAKMPRRDAARLAAAPALKDSQYPLPAFIRYISTTSFGLYSDDGSVLLFDCGGQSVIDRLEEQLQFEAIRQVEACLVTHYHDDHTDSLYRLKNQLGCPVYCPESMTHILEQPQCYDLPCLSPHALKIDRSLKHGETWCWHEYQITAFHLPGQTLNHGGYLVQGHQQTIFFIGDSFSPLGIDDYCAGNRNFLAEDRGFMFCLSLIRRLSPDFLINAHQGQMFSFSEEAIDQMLSMLKERKQLLAELTPWQAPDFALDPFWVRPNPFDHYTKAGHQIIIGLEWTNHSEIEARGEAEIVLPPDWQAANQSAALKCAASVPAMTCGLTVPAVPGERPDAAVHFSLCVPQHAAGIYVLPLRITWQGRYLGQQTQVRVIVG